MPLTKFLGAGLGLCVLLTPCPAYGQEAPRAVPSADQPPVAGLRNLSGADEKRAKQLSEQIGKAMQADHWDEASADAESLLALRTRIQGARHFEVADAAWELRTIRRVAALPKDERTAYLSTRGLSADARSLWKQGKYAAAQSSLEKALEINRRVLGEDHPTTAESDADLAFLLMEQGKFAISQGRYEKAIKILHRLVGDDHPKTAIACNDLALNLQAQGKYHAAETTFEKALTIKRRLFTDDSPSTAATYNNIANLLVLEGKSAEAQPLHAKALEIARRLLGDDDYRTATSYSNLACALDQQARYAEAQPLHEKAMEIRRRILGDDHRDTAESYNNLAANLGFQGNYAEAQTLHEKALVVYRRLLGDGHPDLAAFYNNLAVSHRRQGKYALAEPLYEKALALNQRSLGEEHPQTALSMSNLATNYRHQGNYDAAMPLDQKALDLCRQLLADDHPRTVNSYGNWASDLNARGRYDEARDQWARAAHGFEASRLSAAFAGSDRAIAARWTDPLPHLAAVQARLGQPAEAWQSLEAELGRGLLDELAARQDRRLTLAEQARLRELTTELERLDRLVGANPKGLDQAERLKRFADLKHERELASIALGEFRMRLVRDHGPLAGQVARLNEIQAMLPVNAALIAWVDVPPPGPNAADPDGEHWGVAVRSRGISTWVPIAGTGPDGLWTKEDAELASRVRTELRSRPDSGPADLRSLVEKLRTQRLEPLAKALGATADGLPPARTLVVLTSTAMAGIPVEAFLATDDSRTVSYAPSGTLFKYLREQPRPDRHAGLLALGDPVYEHPDKSSEPKPVPDHGLLVNVAIRGSNAANHGLKDGDVLLAYNGQALIKKDDLKVVAEGEKAIAVEVWRDGRPFRRELAPGELGVMIDPNPAPVAIAEQRKLQQVLTAARSGDEDFAPLPGTRREVEALAQLFQSDGRPSHGLLGADASEPELDRLATANELRQFAYIHLATHGVIDEGIPTHSAVILTQTGLPDPLEQALSHKPVFDGRLSVREIQRSWDLKAELVTLSACETALGRESGGEGFVGFTQALLMSGARSVCLSLWKVDDTATALLMTRFYQNLLGKHLTLSKPMPKAEALREAKVWLRGLTKEAADLAESELKHVSRGEVRRKVGTPLAMHPYEHPHFWAAFVLVGDPD